MLWRELRSRLLKRIPVRERRSCIRATINQDPCHRHFWRESLCENENCKKCKKWHVDFCRESLGETLRQQKATVGTYSFSLHLKHHKCWNVTKTKTGATRRGPSGSTIIIYPSYPWATPLPPDKELLSERASSPTSWGELIIQRVSCSPHTQLSRPMSWGHHILEWRTTENSSQATMNLF